MRRLAGRLFDTALGVLGLALANAALDPVPLSAATAWASGLLCAWLASARRAQAVSLAAVGGALAGSGVHLAAHLTGRSTAPPAGIAMHILNEAVLGLAVGAIALIASLGRDLLQRRDVA